MKRIIFLMGFLFLGTSSALAQMCTAQPGNAPGDIIQAYVHFWDSGNNDFYPSFNINGARVVPWPDNYGGVSYLPDNPSDQGSRCFSECWPIQFMARTSNVSFSVDVIGGNGSGWRCSIVASVVGRDEGAVKKQKKAVAERKRDQYRWLSYFFGLFAIGPCFDDQKVDCAGATAGALVSTVLADHQDKIVQKDPWDPNFLTIYDNPPWPDLGIPWTNDWYVNQMISYAHGAVQMVDMILVEVDRYSSCQMANVDCLAMGVNHQAAIDWAVWMLGWHLNEIGNNAWVVAWIMEQQGADPQLVEGMRWFAQTGNEAGWEYQQ